MYSRSTIVSHSIRLEVLMMSVMTNADLSTRNDACQWEKQAELLDPLNRPAGLLCWPRILNRRRFWHHVKLRFVPLICHLAQLHLFSLRCSRGILNVVGRSPAIELVEGVVSHGFGSTTMPKSSPMPSE